MTTKIEPHALAALALAAHVRNVALEDGINPDTLGLSDGDHDEWLRHYECALGWASLEGESDESLQRRIHVIVRNLVSNRWAPKP